MATAARDASRKNCTHVHTVIMGDLCAISVWAVEMYNKETMSLITMKEFLDAV